MRILLLVTLLLALIAAPVRATGPRCGMKEAFAEAAPSGCCATMKCCAAPQEKLPQSTVASTAETQPMILGALARPLLQREVAARGVMPLPLAGSVAHGPRRFALFCTFLI